MPVNVKFTGRERIMPVLATVQMKTAEAALGFYTSAALILRSLCRRVSLFLFPGIPCKPFCVSPKPTATFGSLLKFSVSTVYPGSKSHSLDVQFVFQ
jgi:hypothetical protein